MTKSSGTPENHPEGRRDNGLTSTSFVPLAEVDATIGAQLLVALARARIPAYLQPLPDPAHELLYAAASDRGDARNIITAVLRADDSEHSAVTPGGTPAGTPGGATGRPPLVSRPELLAGRDTDAEFSALVADWHVDTVAAIRSAERDLNREDADWRARISPPPPTAEDSEEEHFIPPAPPPLPRLSATSIWALLLVGASLLMLVAGDRLGLGDDISFMLGIGGILVGAGVFVMKLRAQPSDDDDDGAVI